jgi:hypothetical protein
MAHVLFANQTVKISLDELLDPSATIPFIVDSSLLAEADSSDTLPTEQMPALPVSITDAETAEQPALIEPLPSTSEPAYFIEVRPPRGAPRLLSARAALDDALSVAAAIHPSVADVTIREVLLPCDVSSLGEAFSRGRSWSREPNGVWSPALD